MRSTRPPDCSGLEATYDGVRYDVHRISQYRQRTVSGWAKDSIPIHRRASGSSKLASQNPMCLSRRPIDPASFKEVHTVLDSFHAVMHGEGLRSTGTGAPQ